MGAVVWDTLLESEVPALTSLGGYGKHQRESIQHHHHHHHHLLSPGGYPSHLSALTHALHLHHDPTTSHTPATDIRETKLAYHIEIEAPGLSDKSLVKIHWIPPLTVSIEGKTMRRPLFHGRETDGDAMWDSDDVAVPSPSPPVKHAAANDSKDGGPCVRCAGSAEEQTTRLIQGERKMGGWRRCFTMPANVDMESLRAELEAGLLHLSVLKQEGSGETGVRIGVE